ncbi:MAG: radical SAM protein [bacterium]
MTHYRHKKPQISAFPTVLQIELTNRCNLNCIMCPRQGMSRQVGDMSLELFKQIVEQLKGKTELAILHLLGESLLNPHLFEMIDYCKEGGIMTVLSTNSTLLRGEKVQKLLDFKLDILLPFLLMALVKKPMKKSGMEQILIRPLKM